MEEKNKKKRMLYVLLGAVALLIVLVGGTYAYFSASVSNSNTIGGNTQNINNNSLTLTVKKVVFNGTNAPSNDLVPAYFGVDNNEELNVSAPSELGLTQVSSMLAHKCEQDGFTGCHVYQINISADQNITHANLLLNLSVSNLNGASSIENKNQWGYVVFQADGTVDSSTGATSGLTNPVLNANNGAPAAIGNGVTNLDIHNDSTLSSTVVTYYLLVYLNDTGESQNNVVSNSGDANYAVGSYSGTLELQALGGKVRACFTPNGVCEAEVSNGTLRSRLVQRVPDPDNPESIIGVIRQVFGRTIDNESINNIYTVNHTSVPSDALYSWDASEEQNGSVMAWVTGNGEPIVGDYNYCKETVYDSNGKVLDAQLFSEEVCNRELQDFNVTYNEEFSPPEAEQYSVVIDNNLTEKEASKYTSYNLYIGQVGGVKAPSDSSELFAGFTNANIIDLSNLDTSNVTDMSEMFSDCSSVTILDLRSFNFNSIVERNGNIQGLFDGAYDLTTITCAAEDETILCSEINETEYIGIITINNTRQCEGISGSGSSR